jgi:predicted DNA-binding antitoxin AbrB/MazE fold protein
MCGILGIMSQFIQAIYEQGVFRPLEPVQLAEHAQVSLVVSPEGSEGSKDKGNVKSHSLDILQRQQASLAKLRAEMDSLPSGAPEDGLGGADHDLILYGWRK